MLRVAGIGLAVHAMGTVVDLAPGREARPGILGHVTTLAINDDLYAEVQRRAAAEGTTDAAVVEAALAATSAPTG